MGNKREKIILLKKTFVKNSFQIFKSDNKTFHWDINNILLVLIFFMWFLSILKIQYISTIAEKVLLFIFFIIFAMLFINIYRKKPLNGVLNGTVTFDGNRIQINNSKFKIRDIQKIFLRINDYEGKENMITRPSLFPKISNGTNNLLNFNLKDGEKIKLFFKIEYENQIEELQPFIISLIINNLITKEEGIETLQFNNDYMLDKFNEELNNKRA